MSHILDSDYQTLTVKDENDQILIRNINEYNLLKYKDFKGQRIKLKILNCEIEETFNNGVFNVKLADQKLQTHNKIELAKRIIYCKENNTIEPIIELFKEELRDQINKEFFAQVLKPFENRIKILDDESIIIDQYFKVDKNGQAYYLNKQKKFMHLCIVAGSQKFKHMINHALGRIKVDFRTVEIYYKILFLLYPDKTDTVFYNQLPKHIKEVIS